MPTQTELTATLDRLKAMLKRKPLTAKKIAEEFKTSRPTAYQRIRAMKKRGDEIYELEEQAEGTGPRPIAYGCR